MEDEEVIIDLNMLSDLELVELYIEILNHIKYLQSNVIELESDGTTNE